MKLSEIADSHDVERLLELESVRRAFDELAQVYYSDFLAADYDEGRLHAWARATALNDVRAALHAIADRYKETK